MPQHRLFSKRSYRTKDEQGEAQDGLQRGSKTHRTICWTQISRETR